MEARTILGFVQPDHSIDTPDDTIPISSPCFSLKEFTTSCSVGFPPKSNRSQRVHVVSPYYVSYNKMLNNEIYMRMAYLLLRRSDRLREPEERKCEVDETIPVVLDILLLVNDL